ncbi:50S ribosomal protein L24 [Candidatus Hecatella orcuttiae]|uniref:50S ribosomal protein L24 n=1 Tax=Candidatus Hecatella orcuttiae TaxID=1935119 RepID=UPI002867FA2D|nr:50S ribosomal protein L24 [Candidatus Hecatella orcuttiae]
MTLVSAKPSKQRKAMWTAPLHKRRKLMSAHLSLSLMEKYGKRALPLRKGDTVKILRGDYKGMEGKVTKVDLKRLRVTVDGVTKEKADGTTVHVPIAPSNLLITKLNLEDKWRSQRLSLGASLKEAGLEAEEMEEKKKQGGGESG